MGMFGSGITAGPSSRRMPDGQRDRRGTQSLKCLLIAAASAGIFYLVSIYAESLRDPRFLDGWLLAGAMGVQLCFHVAIRAGSLSPKSAKRWRQIHLFVGYILIAVFISHSDFSLPDTSFEWALWACFVLVSLSGVFGTYVAWSLKSKRGLDERISYDRILARRAELAREVEAAVAKADKTHPDAAAIALPAPPYGTWIAELYATHLHDFFQGPRNYTAHLLGSQRPLKRLTDEIDNLSRYVDAQNLEILSAIRILVIEKDQLDFARVYLGLTNGWLFVHVPVTYALGVLSVLHVLVVYAYSSGAW